METVSVLACLALAGSLCLASGSADGDTDGLFLTPLIKACNYSEAKARSNVTFFKNYGIKANAYSGYITVNEEANSNLFFLFFEAENDPSTAPLMLWTQGGPGLSALFGLLLQNGPLKFDIANNFSRRELSIQNHMSVIYLDTPVGAGFSFTRNDSGYARLLPNVTKDIKEFLRQFLELFSEYKGRDFYPAGDSYAARYSVALAQEMLSSPGDLNLTFQGVIGGVGFLAPIFQLADSSDFLFQTSMLNAQGYDAFKMQFKTMRDFAYSGNSSLAAYALSMLFNTIFTTNTGTLFQNLTLYNDHASPLYTQRPLSMIFCVLMANSTEFKTAIHAGANASLQYANPDLHKYFALDWLLDITEIIEFVLNKTRVLFYSGQLDALFPSTNLQGYFQTLNWTYTAEYNNASRIPWRPHNMSYGAAGFIKSAGNFTSAVMLGMSHYAGFDKPDETYYLMMQFVNRKIGFSPQIE